MFLLSVYLHQQEYTQSRIIQNVHKNVCFKVYYFQLRPNTQYSTSSYQLKSNFCFKKIVPIFINKLFLELKNTSAIDVKKVRFVSPLKVFFSSKTSAQCIVNGIRTVWEKNSLFIGQSKEEPPLLCLKCILYFKTVLS